MFLISKIEQLQSQDLAGASVLLNSVPEQSIACVNWPESFPAKPQVRFRMAHNGKELFIHFTVQEETTLALITEDNGEVWTDSCVEFFLSLDDSGYYNFEFTCIGKALLGFRKERPHATHATPEIMSAIQRLSSLGCSNFKEKKLEHSWELTVAIPATALFRHQIGNWDELTARINLYKCGDNLSTPHYLSWQPIDTETPNFHVPRCFKEVTF